MYEVIIPKPLNFSEDYLKIKYSMKCGWMIFEIYGMAC